MHQLSEVTIRSIAVSEMDNNVYLLTSRSSGAQVLIDAADDAPAILALLADAQEDTDAEARVALIITTHAHWDHVRALAEVKEATHARTAAGAEDVADIAVPTDVALQHHDVGSFEGFELEAIHLRGHTPGSVALLYRDPHGPAHLFTGDSLFPGGVGNTQGDPARFASLIEDVGTRIFDYLPDDTLVHPGHGAGTTLGAERGSLTEWKQRGW
ncbi:MULTISPECIES: MBL fold metallo-hydrolase [unclassified Arthrobacter]|uniref:MBL fold metallo-hydrolase n=1 Tax=unclassified Arthrobacter TaxID=235627 RepID=UPI0006F58351|nr:MBL fold metallo-hydrolase [Arthrobacter sp. Leaf234]KQN99561.1 Zn-dependent hydrolase [Arthrobacter sp. Leaf234]